MDANPLLDFTCLPCFEDILPQHSVPAIEALLNTARHTISRVANETGTPSWENFVEPITDDVEKLSRAWGIIGHLNAVVNTPALRDAYNAMVPKVAEFWTELGQNLALLARYQALVTTGEYAAYSAARKKVIENTLRDFRLSGATLPAREKTRFAEIQCKLAELSARFEQNVLDATDAFTLIITDVDELSGVPSDVIAMLAEMAREAGVDGYLLTLQLPCYLPIMQYANHRPLRKKLYEAYVTRASELGPAEHDTTSIIREKLQLSEEEAHLLGFANYAELSLFTKMAENPAEVIQFIRDLARRARPFAVSDYQQLAMFAHDQLGIDTLEAWDISYASEKLRMARFDFSDQEVKEYFPEKNVLAGLFNLVHTLFGITVKEGAAPVWHPDVRYFEIWQDSVLLGAFYLDLYAREGKRSGAWMDDLRSRRVKGDHVQTPLACLTCNFSRPVGGKPALLTHDEVITLFHEFGHGLHHMLTRVDELFVAGISGVEWDAVELPSQFMENFCWEWDVLQAMTAHVEHGKPLPRELFDKMMAARHFQSGLMMVRQLEYALFDMCLYSDFDTQQGDWLALLDEIRREIAVIIPPTYNRFPNSFSHIFAGGYAAGYYSYKWAEVLSADAYAAFEEAGGANRPLGVRFWNAILAVGGVRPALESFCAFRGRAPTLDALLRHSGMASDSAMVC